MNFRGICDFCGQTKEGVRRIKNENRIMCNDCWEKDHYRETLEDDSKGGDNND